jgi:hypothetical protein
MRHQPTSRVLRERGSASRIRLCLADPHPPLLVRLRAQLEHEPDIEIVDEAAETILGAQHSRAQDFIMGRHMGNEIPNLGPIDGNSCRHGRENAEDAKDNHDHALEHERPPVSAQRFLNGAFHVFTGIEGSHAIPPLICVDLT